jgi:hypothetical protein
VTGVYEPRQVRKEAAVSKAVCVVALSTLFPGGEDLLCAELERGCTAKAFFNRLFP